MTTMTGSNGHRGQRKLVWGIVILLGYIAVILTLAFLAELLHTGGSF